MEIQNDLRLTTGREIADERLQRMPGSLGKGQRHAKIKSSAYISYGDVSPLVAFCNPWLGSILFPASGSLVALKKTALLYDGDPLGLIRMDVLEPFLHLPTAAQCRPPSRSTCHTRRGNLISKSRGGWRLFHRVFV